MPRIYAESGGMEGGISVERLTERHYKESRESSGYYMKCSETCHIDCGEKSYCEEVDNIVDRLGAIEDILGDEYDLDRLRELVEADRDGRCVVIPDFVWKVGETKGVIKVPYKTWMGRFIGTKFFKTEKEAAEAALKGEQNGG